MHRNHGVSALEILAAISPSGIGMKGITLIRTRGEIHIFIYGWC